MDHEVAKEILGIEDISDKVELKKKYRQLMHEVHPDNVQFRDGLHKYDAATINEAYKFLCKNKITIHRSTREKTSKWDAPKNKNAYCKRPIYDDVTDMDGNVIGNIIIDQDKYLWTKEEEFRFFLKSLFDTSKSILDEIDHKLNRPTPGKFIEFQGELTYNLAGQFIDSTKTLFEMNMDVEDDDTMSLFYIPAMLEMDMMTVVKGDTLYPEKISKHRLYVKDENGQSVGYLSFTDDRLPFVVVPILKQKNVKIKLRLASNKYKENKRMNLKSTPVDMWLKIGKEQNNNCIDNITLKIEKLLSMYETGKV